MATIESNEAEAVGLAMREAMLEQVRPIVRARPAAVVEEREPVGMGWLRDLPDFRDYTEEHEAIKSQLEAIGGRRPEGGFSAGDY
jgi:hypothetical protein